MNQTERRHLLLHALLSERPEYETLSVPADPASQKTLLRGLMNVRPPRSCSEEFFRIQDEYLTEETRKKGITDLNDLVPMADGLYLWQGDITTLRCDAIVNAANSGLTGCYVPSHRCIDNCIHTFAGIQLRLACEQILEAQGHEEPVGQAKITPAFNLPYRYVLHTVGPYISGPVTHKDQELLASCYRSCLALAADQGLESVAFCCISTGEFHFPNEEAAKIAVETVRAFQAQNSNIRKVIFNVFKERDKEIYESLLQSL